MNLVESLRAHRLLAIIRGTDPTAALRTVLALAEEGIEAVEVSLTTKDATSVIARARAELGPKALVGAGTVRTAADAARAVDAGASFLVTPALVDGLQSGDGPDVPVLMGALTPSEIEGALARGACAVKLFPGSLGGPGYLRALRDPFPEVPFVPVGGVDAAAAGAYLALGATAVGVGSPLVGDAADGGDLGELRARVAVFRGATEAEETP
ncbi:bifunctional 4-hydroxy-2-oxoglutarate aldolase/2-dehydro-3-deoxy-phosphogluconate aldolase [Streptomyces sp. NPDC087903]|uniref:bifunctional 4-hydroxy-2-oxoglutarate aldolase/2-dehydro-3-deoxy-phosphogluconate aldolase n=1 Tax=Streptomyces sp. NPDC087903 TaxID=3365819 RepID=UPI00382712E9